MIAKPTPYNAHFEIPASDPELQIKVKNIKNKNKFFLELTKSYFAGKLDNSKSKRDSLKDEKLQQEVLQLKINNKIKLIHDLHKNPAEVVAIINNPDLFKVDEPTNESGNLSASQWDYVYGCLIDGWKIEGRLRTCTICQNDCGHTDESARKHINATTDIKHKTAIDNALRSMLN